MLINVPLPILILLFLIEELAIGLGGGAFSKWISSLFIICCLRSAAYVMMLLRYCMLLLIHLYPLIYVCLHLIIPLFLLDCNY